MAMRFELPKMSLTMEEGVVIRWLKQEGEEIKKNDPLLELETDKTNAELTAPCAGKLLRQMFAAGSEVPVGAVICVIDDGTGPDVADDAPAKAAAAPDAPAAGAAARADAPCGGKPRISPLAAKIAAKEGVDTALLTGTGPRGCICKKDVLDALAAAPAPAPATAAASGAVTEVPFAGIRKKTAQNMLRSRLNTAALTTFAEVDMGNIKRMREFVNVSFTAYVVKACQLAIAEFPYINSTLAGDKILLFEDANINVAVSAGDTLVTPVMMRVNALTLKEVGTSLANLAEKARDGRLTLQDFEGGTFTVTNSGVFGSLFFTPIINYPQCAILGIGKIMDKPVVKDGQIAIAPMMNLCLSYDHQLVDGSTSVKFLQRVKHFLENPGEMI